MRKYKNPEMVEQPEPRHEARARTVKEMTAEVVENDPAEMNQRPTPAAEKARQAAIEESGVDPNLPPDQRPVETWSVRDHLDSMRRT